MTDEGQTGQPMDAIEAAHAMAGMAAATRSFYQSLREEGFKRDEALSLTTTWLASVSRGAAS